MSELTFLFPSDPLNDRRVDPHYARERDYARDNGYSYSLVDHDALQNGDVERAVSRVSPSERAVYRGWMLTAREYAEMEKALLVRAVTLFTSASQYKQAHELPGWIQALSPITAETLYHQGDDARIFAAAVQDYFKSGRVVLRDYSKSMKHYWDEAMYVPDVSDERSIERIAQRLRELRDDAFTGGFVARRFEEYEGNEYRTWWVNGVCVLTTLHPDCKDEGATVDAWDIPNIESFVSSLHLPFVTVDVTRRSDGVWRVVELGDAQVSDYPASDEIGEILSRIA